VDGEGVSQSSGGVIVAQMGALRLCRSCCASVTHALDVRTSLVMARPHSSNGTELSALLDLWDELSEVGESLGHVAKELCERNSKHLVKDKKECWRLVEYLLALLEQGKRRTRSLAGKALTTVHSRTKAERKRQGLGTPSVVLPLKRKPLAEIPANDQSPGDRVTELDAGYYAPKRVRSSAALDLVRTLDSDGLRTNTTVHQYLLQCKGDNERIGEVLAAARRPVRAGLVAHVHEVCGLSPTAAHLYKKRWTDNQEAIKEGRLADVKRFHKVGSVDLVYTRVRVLRVRTCARTCMMMPTRVWEGHC